MRSLIREVLEPVTDRNEQEAEKYLYLERKVTSILKRLEVVEYSLNIDTVPQKQASSIVPQKTVTLKLSNSEAEMSMNSDRPDEKEARETIPPQKVVPNVFEQIFEKISNQEFQRKRENLEIRDWCKHTETRVDQMNMILQEETIKMAKHVRSIEGIEKLTLNIAEDLSKFTLSLTDANNESRQLIIDECKVLSQLMQQLQIQKKETAIEIQGHAKKIEELEDSLGTCKDSQDTIVEQFRQIETSKVDRGTFDEFLVSNENKIFEMDETILSHDNHIKSLENYVEKYVPCNIQSQIIGNLKQFVSKDIINRLKSQSNKVQAGLTAQMLADNGNGTILSNTVLLNTLNVAPQGVALDGSIQGPSKKSGMDITSTSQGFQKSEEGNGFDDNRKRDKKGKKKGAQPEKGADFDWDDDVESTGSFQKNTELDIMKLGQRLNDLEKKHSGEIDQIKQYAQKAAKEQQFYIETLHQDMEINEKNRVRKNKEDEVERIRLMEDIIKLYEKIKSFDGNHNEIERKVMFINDRVSQIKSVANTGTVSPGNYADGASDYKAFISGSPGRSTGAGFFERQLATKDAQRLLTANTVHLKRRKVLTTGRPSISQGGVQIKSAFGHHQDAASFTSIPQIWAPPLVNEKNKTSMKISTTPSGFRLSGTGIGVSSETQTEAKGLTLYNQVSIKNQTLNLSNMGDESHAHRVIVGNIGQMSNSRIKKGSQSLLMQQSLLINQSVPM